MVRETLLRGPASAAESVFPDTSLSIDACVNDYVVRVKQLWGDRLPDLVILGMGDDGHIASLFPPLSGLALGDERFALHTTTPSTGSGQAPRFAVNDRITLALNPIAAAQAHLFLLSGADKLRVWEEMLQSSEDERRWPAKRVLASGSQVWVVQR